MATKAELERIANMAAHKAVAEVFKTLGVDVSEPFEMQADFAHLRLWRRTTAKIRMKAFLTATGVLIAGGLATLWLVFRGH